MSQADGWNYDRWVTARDKHPNLDQYQAGKLSYKGHMEHMKHPVDATELDCLSIVLSVVGVW